MIIASETSIFADTSPCVKSVDRDHHKSFDTDCDRDTTTSEVQPLITSTTIDQSGVPVVHTTATTTTSTTAPVTDLPSPSSPHIDAHCDRTLSLISSSCQTGTVIDRGANCTTPTDLKSKGSSGTASCTSTSLASLLFAHQSCTTSLPSVSSSSPSPVNTSICTDKSEWNELVLAGFVDVLSVMVLVHSSYANPLLHVVYRVL